MNMKKILLSFCMAACALFATAKDYTDNLVVTVDGNAAPVGQTVISIEEIDSTGIISISLKDFSLMGAINVGTIHVNNVPVTNEGNYKSFSLEDKAISVTEGEDTTVVWNPEIFDGLPIDISGKYTDDKLYCALDLTFGEGEDQQVIHVTFGTDDFPSSVLSALADDPDKLVNVYTILGIQVKSQVKKNQALDGLQRGIYIVDGKKVIKK